MSSVDSPNCSPFSLGSFRSYELCFPGMGATGTIPSLFINCQQLNCSMQHLPTQIADGADVMAGITRLDGVSYPVLAPNEKGKQECSFEPNRLASGTLLVNKSRNLFPFPCRYRKCSCGRGKRSRKSKNRLN